MAPRHLTLGDSPDDILPRLSQTPAATFDPEHNGPVIGLAVACGALFVTACGFAYAMCRWRMRYLEMRKRSDGDGVIELKAHQKHDEIPETENAADDTAASGAL
ncbi:hypothetical protein CDD83_3860 [Cordyceps sp. RAO-2017]|nr:hypothetical protein CDD83_3860 [Cordyceps sp. RAO-2017]